MYMYYISLGEKIAPINKLNILYFVGQIFQVNNMEAGEDL